MSNQKIVEYRADPLKPKVAFEGEDEIDATIEAQCPDAGGVALHVTREGAERRVSSLYLTPAEAYVLAERIRTAAWIAERLGAGE